MDAKKGGRQQNPLEEVQVRKAVLALQSFVEKQKADLPKKPLVENPEYVSAIITRKLIPVKGSNKPIIINIPHSIRGGENDAEMCLIVKNGDKARIKAALAADPVPGLAKIMDIKKLKKSFSRFDDKRTLAGAYDLFLADDRILNYLPTALGNKFFVKKKQPIAVRVSRKEVSNSIRSVYRRTQMTVSTGVCSNVKVAHMGQTVEEIVENILAAMHNCAQRIPKGWGGIQSISIKTNESVALPIFNSLATLAKLPPVAAKKAKTLTKRKLDEVNVTTEEEEAAPKALKKARKEVAPAKKEVAPAKKEPAPAKKEPAPAKKEPAPAKKEPAPAKKEPTPAKKAEKKTPAPVKEATTTEKPSKKRKSEHVAAKTADAPASAKKAAAKTATKSAAPKKKTPPAKKK